MVKSILVVAVLCGASAAPLIGQTNTDSATATPRRQNAWVSLGLGVSQLGEGATISGWYGNNKLVLGAQLAGGSEGILSSRDVQAISVQVGVRAMGRRGTALIAIGPARMDGWHNEPGGTFFGHSVRDNNGEFGVAASAEALVHMRYAGLGVGLFAAGSGHEHLTGATVTLHLGSIGG